MTFIALDLGTSFIKGAVLDVDGLRLSHVHRAPFRDAVPRLAPLHHEIDPLALVKAVEDLVHALLPHAPNCEGIVMCTQMHSLVLVGVGGEPLSNAITWRDQRVLGAHPAGGGSYYDVLLQRLSADERRRTGSEWRPGLPVCFLFWMAQQAALPEGAVPMTMADFVLSRLCGSDAGIELTGAAAHGVLNLETIDWDREVIAKLGLERLRWPGIHRGGEAAVVLRAGSASIPCYNAVGDQQCSLLGAGLAEGELSLNIATGSQVSLLSPRLECGQYQSRPFFDGQFLNTITTIPAGRALNLLADLLTEMPGLRGDKTIDAWDYIGRAAAGVEATDLQVNLAFFASACGDRGCINNMHEGNLTVGHLFRAAFEGMADNYAAFAGRLSPNRAWERLVFSGGLARKLPLLRQIIERRFAVDGSGPASRLCPASEDSLLGLLTLALVHSGRASCVLEAIAQVQQSYGG